MMRTALFLGAVTLVVASACTSSDRDDPGDAAVDTFCDAFGDYVGVRQAIRDSRVGDPRRLQAPLAAIEPPAALSEAWPAFAAWEHSNTSLHAVGTSHDWLSPPFWVEPLPESQAASEVERFWERECVEARGYEVTEVVSETDPELPPYDQSPDGQGIRVVEVGFTQGRWLHEPGLYAYSYGVVVENTSDYVALNTEVEVRIAGSPQRHVIPILLPGQRFGLGDETDMDRKWTEAPEVTVGEGYWWPAEHEVIEYAAVATRDIIILERQYGFLGLRFTIDSDYPVVIDNVASSFPYETYATPYVVFWNADGDIIGGGSGNGDTSIPPGRSFGSTGANVSSVLRPADIDHTRTRVYF